MGIVTQSRYSKGATIALDLFRAANKCHLLTGIFSLIFATFSCIFQEINWTKILLLAN